MCTTGEVAAMNTSERHIIYLVNNKVINVIVRLCEFGGFIVIIKTILFALSIDPFTYIVFGTVDSVYRFHVALHVKTHRRSRINLTSIFNNSICAKGILSENT